jgi:hypothetical protein
MAGGVDSAGTLGSAFGRGATSTIGKSSPRQGAGPLPIHIALRIARPRLLVAGWTLSAYSFASIPRGNWTLKHSIPAAISSPAKVWAAFSPASSRSYAIRTRWVLNFRKAAQWSGVNPFTP